MAVRQSTKRNVASALWLTEFLLKHRNDSELAFEDLLAQLADCKTLTRYCEQNGLKQGYLLAWVRADPQRSKRFDTAIIDRKFLLSEAALAAYSDILGEKPEKPPTYAEKVTAARDVAKMTGLLHDGPGQVSVNVGMSLISVLASLEEPLEGESRRIE